MRLKQAAIQPGLPFINFSSNKSPIVVGNHPQNLPPPPKKKKEEKRKRKKPNPSLHNHWHVFQHVFSYM